jgi:putative transposase
VVRCTVSCGALHSFLRHPSGTRGHNARHHEEPTTQDAFVGEASAERERSMSRKRNPWDNAVIESFFSPLRFELLCRTRFADPDEAARGISEWIERLYNLHRRHTTLGNVSPINYELAWQMRKQRT